jgi:CRP-like cAMP-binding protein
VKEDFIENVPLFANFTEVERRAISKRMRLETYQQGELVFAKGAESDALYLIKEGWVKLSDNGGRAAIATQGPGSLVGETDFFLGRERSMTARANSALTVWVLDENAIIDIIEEHSEVGLKLGLAFGGSIAQYQRYLMDRLSHIAFMQDLPEDERQAVAECLVPQRYESGEAIFRSGDVASGLYFIESGTVRLIGDGDDFSELGRGDTFGELAVLSGKPHPNSAQATAETIVWQLSPADFARLAESHPNIRSILSRNLRARLSAADMVQAVGMLRRMPLFAEVARETLDSVASRLLLRHVPSGELIFSPGDPGDAMYFVESGQVEIVSEEEERREALARLIPGDFFGEMALMTGKSRTVTARALAHSNLWVLYRTDFDDLLVRHPALTGALSKTLRERLSQAEGSFVEPYLHNIALLGGLARTQLEELAERLHPQAFHSGDTIFFEGRAGDTMYFIESGQVEQSVSSSVGPMVLDTLEQGDFFGEIVLLTNRPHVATAYAVTECNVWALKKRDFDDLLFKYPNLAVVLSRVVSERQVEVMEKMRAAGPAPAARPASAGARPSSAPAPARARPSGAQPSAARPSGAYRAESRPAPARPSGAPPAGARQAPTPARSASSSGGYGQQAGVHRAATVSQPPVSPLASQAQARPSQARPSVGRQRLPATKGISRGADRLSGKVGGRVSGAAVWFATRSPRVKLSILLLLVVFIWLCGITVPWIIIGGLSLAANLNLGGTPGYAYAQGNLDATLQPVVMGALPFVETVTPTPTKTSTPTATPTVTPTPTETPIPTWTLTPVPTDTPVPPTLTPTPVDTPTSTPRPHTPTPRPPTETPTITPTPTPDADYIVASVRQLTPCENEGKHHIFIRVIDKTGNGINNVPVRVCWATGDNGCAKPLTETKNNGAGWIEFAMFKGTYSVQVADAKSQVASGITPDYQVDQRCDATGNTVANSLYHASFEVIFQRTW